MCRLTKDFAVVKVLENGNVILDSLLEWKHFCRKHAAFEDFFTNMKVTIMEQVMAEKSRHKEWRHCSDPSSIRLWRQLAQNNDSLAAEIPGLSCLVHKFFSTQPRRKNSKHFVYQFPIIKKTKTKTKKCDNLDMLHANCNTKNVQNVLAHHFCKEFTAIISYKDEWIVKIGAPRFPSALLPKTKSGWIAEEVDT